MKKIWMLLLICGISTLSLGQGVEKYNIILNADTSPLNATLKSTGFVFEFEEKDVLTITFEDLEPNISKKTIVITSDSNNSEIFLGSFDRYDLCSDNHYNFQLFFKKFSDKLQAGESDIYNLVLKDGKEQQNLLRFKLL